MKSTFKKSVVAIMLFAGFFANAQWGEKIKGNGNVTSKAVTTTSYDKVAISGFFDVELVSGTEGKLTISGEENLLQYIVAEVIDNTLQLHLEKGKNIRPSSGKQIVITVPFESLNEVSLVGSGNVKTKSTIKTVSLKTSLVGSGGMNLSVNAETIEAMVTGSGDLKLNGTAKTLKSKITGSGDFSAYDLTVLNAEVEVSGSGNSRINCSEKLFARVSGSGDVNYKGNPKVKDTKASGSGVISKT